MATYLKYSILIAVCLGAFFITYTSINSGQEETLLMLRDHLSRAQEWPSYETVQTIWSGDQQQLKIHSQAKLDPYVIWVSSAARLTDTEEFHFQIYFQPDVLYIYSENANHWNKADYTHPVAGEVQGLKEPFPFWERILMKAKTIQRTHHEDNTLYKISLHPFQDEVHGVRFDDVLEGTLTVSINKESKHLQKTVLEVKMKPSLARLHEHIVYMTEYRNVGETTAKELPKEALEAERLK
ncbi:hypothetical protein [Ammoniphilus sp. YIM 78166]|uniref:hypothetical protein n=1 Tax=Ammoniphilus sp. YIM 78166 TaxID=1644106 RepID=UPI0010701A53|nr:hypothetical protein [Ammoniphilus sp. YIM 78166]